MFRIVNALRCYAAYLFSLCGRIRVRHMPMFVSVEPANICQLRCSECPVGQRANSANAQHFMSMPVWQRVIEQVAPYAYTMQFYFQGEPLLNPLLPKMIARAREAGLFTVVSTNAQALTRNMAHELVKSGLHRIIVSIDGFSEESYAAYRVGGDLHRALEGMQFLREAKAAYGSSICIELQVLRLRSNEHEWEWIRQHYRTLGATRLVFKTAQLYDYQHGHSLMPTDERYSRYKKGEDGTYHLIRPRRRSCYRLWSGCVVTTTGEVLPCCYDKAGEHAFGSLIEQHIEQVWHNKNADDFRRQVLQDSHAIPICRECYY